MSTATQETRHEFVKLANYQPDLRWSQETLVAKIMEIRTEREEALERKREAALRQMEIEAERQKVIDDRGPFEEYPEKRFTMSRDKKMTAEERSESYGFALVVDRALAVIAKHEKVVEDFAESFRKDPVNAMSWSRGEFAHAAEYKVAMNIKEMYEQGYPIGQIRATSVKNTIYEARYMSRSSSPTSNLMSDYVLQAWADVADKMTERS